MLNLNKQDTLQLIKNQRPDFNAIDFMDDRMLSYLYESTNIYNILNLDEFDKKLNQIIYKIGYKDQTKNYDNLCEINSKFKDKVKINVDELYIDLLDIHKFVIFSFETDLNIVRFVSLNDGDDLEQKTLCFIIMKNDDINNIDITRYLIPTHVLLNKRISFNKIDYEPGLKLQIDDIDAKTLDKYKEII